MDTSHSRPQFFPPQAGRPHGCRRHQCPGWFRLSGGAGPKHHAWKDEATAVFTALLEKGSPLGLYSEEIDPASGLLLGNYPQALTHTALVQAALALHEPGTDQGQQRKEK